VKAGAIIFNSKCISEHILAKPSNKNI